MTSLQKRFSATWRRWLALSELARKPSLTVNDVRALHRALMKHRPGSDTGGQFRDIQNWIGGNDYNPCDADFVPPPPEYVPELMDDLLAFVNSTDAPPVVQAAIAHAQF